ncbi:unnamed protein product [Auanema sp. JU1783]|nr:unnamed protein product [Auanema sp. JU1783]
MEAKRIKLSHSDSNLSSKASSCGIAQAAELSIELENEEKLKVFVKDLRRTLNNKQNIILFIKKRDVRFKILVDQFVKMTNGLGSTSNNDPPAYLKEVTSLIANCCNYSVAACLELKQPHLQFTFAAVKILESISAPMECKQSLIRMVANMCAHKETALFISSSSGLIDKISQFLENDNAEIIKQALRVLRLLSEASFTRVSLKLKKAFTAYLLKKGEYTKLEWA